MTDPFDFEPRVKRYAVMGNPIAHSRSPQIHAAFAAQTGIRLTYERIPVDLGGFAQAVGNFRAAGGDGLNVTVPFKQEACRLAERLTERAKRAGAVNTLAFDTDGTLGDNTDGAGLVYDLTRNLGCDLRGRSILLLGAGGAARGVLGPLLDAAPKRLWVANRTLDKAADLAAAFGHARLHAVPFAATAGEVFDIVINATAASLAHAAPPLPAGCFAADGVAYDMMYGEDTPFMQLARAQGVRQVHDGLGMLVEQAAEAFLLWHGVRPATAEVLAAWRSGRGAGA